MQDPAILQGMIQHLQQTNPELAQYLASNPETLLQLLGQAGVEGGLEDDEGGEAGDRAGQHMIQVTPEERAAIERVCVSKFL